MYEMKIKPMIEASSNADRVIEALWANAIDVKKANALTAANGDKIRGFSNDLRARLALPKLLEMEAKVVEASDPSANRIAESSSAPEPGANHAAATTAGA